MMPPFSGLHRRIYSFDDEPAIVRMASVLLERLGYTVTAVTGSAAALKLFNKTP
jgi:CheY-like chemotaxis protein